MLREKNFKFILVCLILCFICVSCTTLTPEEKKAKNIENYVSKGYSLEDAEILAMTKQERLEYLCPYYDIPIDKSEYKGGDKKYVNIIYDLVIGKYNQVFPCTSRSELQKIFGNHTDFAGFFQSEKFTKIEGEGYRVGYEKQIISYEEAFIRQVKATRIAQEIHDYLHKNGIVKDEMTEYEKANATLNWLLNNYHVKHIHGSGYSDSLFGDKYVSGDSYRNPAGLSMVYDSAYSVLSKTAGDCIARSAAFSILMHIEGIKCQSFMSDMYRGGGTVKHTGHFMNRLILDGIEYYGDWSSFNELRTSEEWLKDKRQPTFNEQESDYLF